jgi:hypothetical protein
MVRRLRAAAVAAENRIRIACSVQFEFARRRLRCTRFKLARVRCHCNGPIKHQSHQEYQAQNSSQAARLELSVTVFSLNVMRNDDTNYAQLLSALSCKHVWFGHSRRTAAASELNNKNGFKELTVYVYGLMTDLGPFEFSLSSSSRITSTKSL